MEPPVIEQSFVTGHLLSLRWKGWEATQKRQSRTNEVSNQTLKLSSVIHITKSVSNPMVSEVKSTINRSYKGGSWLCYYRCQSNDLTRYTIV